MLLAHGTLNSIAFRHGQFLELFVILRLFVYLLIKSAKTNNCVRVEWWKKTENKYTIQLNHMFYGSYRHSSVWCTLRSFHFFCASTARPPNGQAKAENTNRSSFFCAFTFVAVCLISLWPAFHSSIALKVLWFPNKTCKKMNKKRFKKKWRPTNTHSHL